MIDKDQKKESMRAFKNGSTLEECKPELIKRNTFGLDQSHEIYRYFEIKYFLEDIRHNKLTLTKIKPEIWQDTRENILRSHPFKEEGASVSLRDMMETYYGQCWSLNTEETYDKWSFYTKSHGVRIKSTVSQLMDVFFDTRNCCAYLSYFMGEIDYKKEQDIDAMLRGGEYSDFLDSLGLALARSLMVKRKQFDFEEEIRLVYKHCNLDKNDFKKFVNDFVHLNGDLISLPLDLLSIADEIIFSPGLNNAEFDRYKSEIESLGFKGTIKKSGLKKRRI